jgi:hypothetical protein
MSEPTTTSTAIPLASLPDEVAARVRQAGTQQINLYCALAHAPRLLGACAGHRAGSESSKVLALNLGAAR